MYTAFTMLQLQIAFAILAPILSIPLLYLLNKRSHAGILVMGLSALQFVFWISLLPRAYRNPLAYTVSNLFTLSNGCKVSIGCYVDLISVLLLMMVSMISCIVSLYSIAYLPAGASTRRYFGLYSLSLAAMYCMLVQDQLWSMFVGWEWLSIASCLLVSFWYQDPGATQAGKYIWLMNKIGSIAFLIGVVLIAVLYDNLSIPHIISACNTSHHAPYSFLVGFFFLLAGCTKAAQFPFFSWLPHAMVAPIPISALLHTATVLSAGIYLLTRTQPIFPTELNTLLITIGYITAFMGAISAWFQEQVKRMLAYSTLSQYGYIVAAIGLGDMYVAIVYLVMHAFSKTSLFLLTGFTTKLLQSKGYDKQESCITMSCIGKVLKQSPLSGVFYIITLWGIGIIPGSITFLAKEHILEKTLFWAFEGCGWFRFFVFFLACCSSCVTLFYMLNVFARIFCNNQRRYKINIVSALNGCKKKCLMYSSMIMCSVCTLIAPAILQQYTSIVENIYRSSKYILEPSIRVLTSYLLFLFIGHMVTRLLLPHVYEHKWMQYTLRFFLFPLTFLYQFQHHPSGFSPPIRFNYSKKYFYKTEALRINEAIIDYTVYDKKGFLCRMFLNGWYVDSCVKFLGSKVEALSQVLHHIAHKCFHQYIPQLAQRIFVTAKVIHKLDQQLINACIFSIIFLIKYLRRWYVGLQIERVKRYMLWACIGLCVLIFLWILSLK